MARLAILFDMDGVLVDTEPVINKAAIIGLKEFGVTAQPDDFTPFIGRGEIKYIGGVAEKYGVNYISEMKDRVYEIYFHILDQMITPDESILTCLSTLKQEQFPLVLASSADRAKIIGTLKAALIPQATFKVILGAEDVVHKKPAPDIYLKAAEKINHAPKSCVVIEDALNGIQAAKNADMKCIAYTSTFSREILAKEKPDYICDSFKEICETILNLQ
jgi:beta-phosphoglucomutase